MSESPHTIKQVAIEEFYSKEGTDVYWNYRLDGGNWRKELTPFKEIPYVVFDEKTINSDA